MLRLHKKQKVSLSLKNNDAFINSIGLTRNHIEKNIYDNWIKYINLMILAKLSIKKGSKDAKIRINNKFEKKPNTKGVVLTGKTGYFVVQYGLF